MSILKDRLRESTDPFLVWLRDERGVSDTTVYHYYSHYKNVLKFKELNQKTLQRYVQKKKNNFIVRAFLKSLLEFLKQNDNVIEFNFPAKKTGRTPQRIIHDYSENQMDKVREECYRRSKGKGIVFDLLYYGALRRAEVKTIKVNSFGWRSFINNVDKSCEVVVSGKGKKQRPILIPAKVMNNILDLFLINEKISSTMEVEAIVSILENDQSNLFHNLTEIKVWDIVNKASKKALGSPLRPHEIRHHRATQLEKKGLPLRAIQHYLGHSSQGITETYLHTTQKFSLDTIRSVEDGE